MYSFIISKLIISFFTKQVDFIGTTCYNEKWLGFNIRICERNKETP